MKNLQRSLVGKAHSEEELWNNWELIPEWISINCSWVWNPKATLLSEFYRLSYESEVAVETTECPR